MNLTLQTWNRPVVPCWTSMWPHIHFMTRTHYKLINKFHLGTWQIDKKYDMHNIKIPLKVLIASQILLREIARNEVLTRFSFEIIQCPINSISLQIVFHFSTQIDLETRAHPPIYKIYFCIYKIRELVCLQNFGIIKTYWLTWSWALQSFRQNKFKGERKVDPPSHCLLMVLWGGLVVKASFVRPALIQPQAHSRMVDTRIGPAYNECVSCEA